MKIDNIYEHAASKIRIQIENMILYFDLCNNYINNTKW